jgi:hypothetical protein
MKVQKFSVSDAKMVKSPGQDAEIYVGNLVDERNGGPVTIGYGRYAPDQSLTETMEVDDTMIVLEGRILSPRPTVRSRLVRVTSSTCRRGRRLRSPPKAMALLPHS